LIHLATATDRQYLPWCATAILSAIRATSEPCTFHLIHSPDVGADERRQLSLLAQASSGSVEFIPLPEHDLPSLPEAVAAHGGAISCARFLLPQMLTNVDRLIYLDADTLTVDSLAPLAALDMQGAPVAAVLNVVEQAMRTRISRLGLKNPHRYLNSGVLLMDLRRMRELDSVAALLDCTERQAPHLLWVDQDVLNLVFEDNWLALEPRWNVQNSLLYWRSWAEEVFEPSQVEDATRRPAILHFEGPSLAKPWHYLSQHPYTTRYRDMLAETPWACAAPTGRTWFNRLIKPLSRERQVRAIIAQERVKRRLGRSR
jgi:lipopolysaccharide biosynthesis glycosyltransferase